MRSAIIILTLMLSVAGNAPLLCELDCAEIPGHTLPRGAADIAAQDLVTVTPDSPNAAMSHCHGDSDEAVPHENLASHDSKGSTNHHGTHVHPRIVAGRVAKISISPNVPISAVVHTVPFAVPPVYALRFSPDINFSSSMNSPSVFASGVLRI